MNRRGLLATLGAVGLAGCQRLRASDDGPTPTAESRLPWTDSFESGFAWESTRNPPDGEVAVSTDRALHGTRSLAFAFAGTRVGPTYRNREPLPPAGELTVSAAFYPESISDRGLRVWIGNWDDRRYGLKYNDWGRLLGIRSEGEWFDRADATVPRGEWIRLVLEVERPTTDPELVGYLLDPSTGAKAGMVATTGPALTEPLYVGITVWNGRGGSTADGVFVDSVEVDGRTI